MVATVVHRISVRIEDYTCSQKTDAWVHMPTQSQMHMSTQSQKIGVKTPVFTTIATICLALPCL